MMLDKKRHHTVHTIATLNPLMHDKVEKIHMQELATEKKTNQEQKDLVLQSADRAKKIK